MLEEPQCLVSYCTVRGDHEVVTGGWAGCTAHVGRAARHVVVNSHCCSNVYSFVLL